MVVHFVDTGGIVDHHCFNFFSYFYGLGLWVANLLSSLTSYYRSNTTDTSTFLNTHVKCQGLQIPIQDI